MKGFADSNAFTSAGAIVPLSTVFDVCVTTGCKDAACLWPIKGTVESTGGGSIQ